MRVRTDLRFHYEMSYLKGHRRREGLPPREPPFGEPWGDERPLPLELIRPLQPLYAALAGEVAEPRARFDEAVIATLAHYTLGLMRYEPTDLYALHRPVPSPRCLYASQLYYLAPRQGSLPYGLYRFNPVRHCLELRPLSPDSQEGGWLAERVTDSAGGWLLTSAIGRIGHLYGPFAGRLSLLESGHVISQLRLVSGALGVETEVLPCYKGSFASEMLDEGETPLSLIVNRTKAPTKAGSCAPDTAPECPRPWMATSLYRAMLQRNSAHGRSGVLPAPISLSAADILGLAFYAMDDFLRTPSAEALRLQLYLVVSRSEDLEPGIYRWVAEERALLLIRALPPGKEWARILFRGTGFAAHGCPLICVLAADLRGALQASGEEGYFCALEQAGRVAQRLGLSAAAMRLFARPAVSLDEPATDRLLGLHLARETAFYTVLLGRDRDLGFPVRLAL